MLMSKILEYISAPVVVGFILLICLIVVFFLRRKIRKKEKKINEIKTNKLRELALENTLRNKNKQKNKNEIERSEPYEVDYGNGNAILNQEMENNSDKKIFLKVIEHSELSSRDYFHLLSDEIFFGRHFHKNQFVINGDSIAERQCKLWYDSESKKVKIKNLVQKNKVVILRKKERMLLTTNSMNLLFGDEILFDKMTYELFFYDSQGKKQYKK